MAPVASSTGPASSTGLVSGRPDRPARPLTVAWQDQAVDVVVDENLAVGDVLALVLPPDVERQAASVGGRIVHLDQTVAQARIRAGAVVCPAPAGVLRPGRPGGAPGHGGVGRQPTPEVGGPAGPGARGHGIPDGVPAAAPAPGNVAREAGAAPATLGQTSAPGSGSSRAAMAVPISSMPGRVAHAPVAADSRAAEAYSGPMSVRSDAPAGMPAGRLRVVHGAAAGFAVVLGTLAAVTALLSRSTPSASIVATSSFAAQWALATGAGLVLAGAVLAQARRRGGVLRHLVPSLGAAGGAVAAASLSPLDHVALIGAAAGAAFVAMSGHPGTGPDRKVPWVWTAYSTVVGALALGGLAAGAGLVPVALVLLGLLTVLPRVLPSWVIDVEDAALIDIDRLSVTSWSPRERRGQSGLWRVTQRDVDDLVEEARATQTAALVGLVMLSTVACLGLGPGLRQSADGPNLPIALTVVAAAVAPLFSARVYRARIDRILVRAAAAPPALALVSAIVPGMPSGTAYLVAGAAVSLGVALGLLAAAVAQGYRSLSAGRAADALEGVALVAVLPLALWAAGVLEWARGLLV
ncbi:MAG: hypothetical protein IPM08_01675 [Actinomycetales bacterium]|nr:hypothetical protein [Actinomycetales bacterium]